MYKLCPKCEINYIQDGENLCEVCGAQEHSYSKKLVRGRCYGTNSHNIYLDLCRAYDWDEKKAWSFGQKKDCCMQKTSIKVTASMFGLYLTPSTTRINRVR